MNTLNTIALALLLSAPPLLAAPTVVSQIGKVDGGTWGFPSIVSPRRGDLAEQAKLSLATGAIEGMGAPLGEFANGVVASRGDDASQVVFLSNRDDNGARLLMDLGAVKPVAQINTYSFHHFPRDGGARGPQVYSVYGSADPAPDTKDLGKWQKIADVDTRPNQSGDDWGGMHGVQIADDGKLLGNFRHLLWDIRPTLSPRASTPPKSNTFFTEIDVHGPDTLEDAQPAQLAGEGTTVDRFVLVYKTHFDIGYTQLARDVVKGYRTTMIDQALDVVDQNANLPREQQFVWTVPGWPMKEILASWPGQSTERQSRITTAFKDGRFVVHALPFTMHTDLMEPEELARGFGYSSAMNRSIGKPLPRAAKMTDVPCHGWALPTVLKHAGVGFLHIGCNGHSSPVGVPTLFWWEGPDGSRVLTYYSADGYGTGLLPSPRWPHKTWLALVHTGDNHGPPRPDEVQAHIAKIRVAYPKAVITVGELADFANALLAENPDLPVIRKDMPDTWIHGPMASPVGAKIARNTRPGIAAAESLGTLLNLSGVSSGDDSKAISAAYEASLLYAEHTWGLSHAFHRHKLPDGAEWDKVVKDGMPGIYQKFEESWAEHRAYIDGAARITGDLLAKNMDALARAVKADGKRTVVFNPLPWQRSGVVEVAGTPRYVANVPAGGYITLDNDPVPAAPPAAPTDPHVLENTWIRLTLAPDRAAITSVINKADGLEWVKQDAGFGLGEYLYQQFSRADADHFRDTYTRNRNAGFGKNWLPADVPHIDARPTGARWTVSRGGIADVAEARSPAGNGVPHATSLKVTIYHQQPYVDLELGIIDKAATPRPEAGWICLPFAVDAPVFRLGRLGGIADPANDFIPGSNRHLIALDSGMTVSGAEGKGFGLCSPDAPLVSLDKPGCWEFSRDFTPQRPLVFLHLYNNMWSTNFRMWKAGSWTTKVRIWATATDDAGAGLITPSWEARVPLVVASATGPAGTLPASMAGVTVSRKGVLVTAFGKDPDGNPGTLLRVWEQAGVAGDLTISIPGNYKSATPVNLRGEKYGEPVSITEGKFTFPLPAFAPASFVLSPAVE